MNPAIIIFLLLVATSFYLTRLLVWPFWRSMLNAEKRHTEDVSGSLEPPPEDIGLMLKELIRLGFTRLGEEMTDLGKLGKGISWHMVDNDTHTIAVEIAPYRDGPIAGFTTMLTDDAVVTTNCRIGESFSTPNYRADTCRTSIEDTLALHRTNLEQFLLRHPGSPRTFSSMSEILAMERVYRAKHFRRFLRPPLVRSLLTAIAMNVALAGAMISYIITQNAPPFNPLIVPVILIGGTALILMFILYARILHHSRG